MATYVALLRGINLGSRNKIAMGDLRSLFEAVGYGDVTTYIQSGNVVFSAGRAKPERLAGDIEARISQQLGLDVAVLVRTSAQLDAISTANPFLEQDPDAATLHVTFLAAAPAGELVSALAKPPGERADFTVVGREVYLHCPDGYGRTKLNNAFLEKKLGVAATTRGWKTVVKLRELAAG